MRDWQAVIVPSFRIPIFMSMYCLWRPRKCRNISSREYFIITGRPVSFAKMTPHSSSGVASAFTPKPPPTQGVMVRMSPCGMSNMRLSMCRR